MLSDETEKILKGMMEELWLRRQQERNLKKEYLIYVFGPYDEDAIIDASDPSKPPVTWLFNNAGVDDQQIVDDMVIGRNRLSAVVSHKVFKKLGRPSPFKPKEEK
jgi:hypothetical protein